MSDLILLAALLDGPKHGWALKKLAGFIYGAGALHNNLVYPLMKKFVALGWVRRRSEPGHRGQTRAVYSLTLRGNRELMRRLHQFSEKEASSSGEFRLRIGLFHLMEPAARQHILSRRDIWLADREKHFAFIADSLKAMNATAWGHEVAAFLVAEARSERKWIKTLAKKSARATALKKPDRK